MAKGIHDLSLDYNRTYGHEMQLRIHAPEGTDASGYIPTAKGMMIDLVNECEFNSIPHLEKRHNLTDGSVIICKQSYGVQVIDIYPAVGGGEELVPALFRFIPGNNRPQAIIKLKNKSFPSDADEFELYFDDRIKGSGVYTQNKSKDGLLYSINEETGDAQACKIPGLSLPIPAPVAIPDSFFYSKPLCYQPAIITGHAKKNLYVGGYLLFIASQEIIGVGEVEGLICLVTREGNKVSFWSHKVVTINYERTLFNVPILAADSFELIEEITIGSVSNTCCGLCTFDSTGATAGFNVLETIVEATKDGLITRGYFIQHQYAITLSLNVSGELVVSSAKTSQTIKNVNTPSGDDLTLVTPGYQELNERVFGAVQAFTVSEYFIQFGETLESNKMFCGVDGAVSSVWSDTEAWHYSNVANPGDSSSATISELTCFDETYPADSFVSNLQTWPNSGPNYVSHTHSIWRSCLVLFQETYVRSQWSPGSNNLDKAQSGDLDVFNSISAEGIVLTGSYNSSYGKTESGKFLWEETTYNYRLSGSGSTAPKSLATAWADYLNTAGDLGGRRGRYDCGLVSDTTIKFDWTTLAVEKIQTIDVDFDNFHWETQDPPGNYTQQVAVPYDDYKHDICPEFSWWPKPQVIGLAPRHKLTYAGSNNLSQTSIDLYNVNLRHQVALTYTYKENHAAALGFDQATDTDLTWCPSGDEYKNTGTKSIGLETATGFQALPGLIEQTGNAEQPACPTGTIMETITPPTNTAEYNTLSTYDAKKQFPMCCHPDGYVLLSANDFPMLASSETIETDPFNIALLLYNTNDDTFTDIKALYNEALLRDEEALLASGEEYDLTPLTDTVTNQDNISHYMRSGWGVLGTVPPKA